MHPLEEQVGYKFRNSLLLAEALTHPSLGHETQQVHFDNQRLEYLGDAVLQLLFSEHLFRRFPGAGEGQLTKLRARLVSGGGAPPRWRTRSRRSSGRCTWTAAWARRARS